MIRQHWDRIEDSAKEHLAKLEEMAIPQRRRLTEKEQVERYLSRGPEDFRSIMTWLVGRTGSTGAAQKEFSKYVTRMEGLRGKKEGPEARGRPPGLAMIEGPAGGPPPPTTYPSIGLPPKLPWSYYQRVGRKIGVPESFWDWLGQDYPIAEQWRSVAERAQPTVDLKMEPTGYYKSGSPEIISRQPFGTQKVYMHELGHYMDDKMGGVSQSAEWREAVKRWATDDRHKGGHDFPVWGYITKEHPAGSPEKPAWNEGYAYGGTLQSSDVPPYIRPFYPWRDWKALDEKEKEWQERVSAVVNGRFESPEQARAEWEKIPEMDRYRALEAFEQWPNIKNFLDFIGSR